MTDSTPTTSSNLVDRPIDTLEQESIGISSYVEGLSDFLLTAEMPMTVAIQGPWGCGKTSVLNAIRYKLCDTEDERQSNKSYHAISINMWEHCMLRTDAEAFERIIRSILQDVDSIAKKRKIKLDKSFNALVHASALRLFIKTTIGLTQVAAEQINPMIGTVVSKIAPIAADFAKDDDRFLPAKFRQVLSQALKDCITKDRTDDCKRGFIIFIDDLDRIEPETAVSVLDLLKNFFDVERCIFVLSIDFNVVVEGLKAKLGKRDTNDMETYRSYFDKIIQLPFRMPVGYYDIDQYLVNSLQRVGYFSKDEAKCPDVYDGNSCSCTSLTQALTDITVITIGTTPRSIKRLCNYLSLINRIYEAQQKVLVNGAATSTQNDKLHTIEKLIIYIFVCIQNAYQDVFDLIQKAPNFIDWSPTTFHDLEIEQSNEMDSSAAYYERVITHFCNNATAKLKQNKDNINSLLSMIRDLCNHNDIDVRIRIPKLVKLISVIRASSVDSNDDPSLKKYFWTKFEVLAMQNPDYKDTFNSLTYISRDYTSIEVEPKHSDKIDHPYVFIIKIDTESETLTIKWVFQDGYNPMLGSHDSNFNEYYEAAEHKRKHSPLEQNSDANFVALPFNLSEHANWQYVFKWVISKLLSNNKTIKQLTMEEPFIYGFSDM